MSPGRVDQIIGELRALTTDKDRPQDEVTTIAVAIRLLESQQREIAEAKEARAFITGACYEAQNIAAAAQDSVRSKGAVIASLRAALSDTAEALNSTRLIMRDQEARDHAGNMVDVARRIVKATS